MTFRQRLGLGVPPLLLRLALATTFIWSGAVKFRYEAPLTAEQEATYSVIRSGATATPAPPADTEPQEDHTKQADDAGAAGKSVAASFGGVLVLVQNTAPVEKTGEPAADDGDKPAVEEPEPEQKPGANAPAGPPPRKFIAQIALMIHDAAAPDDQGRALLPAFMGAGKWPLWFAYAVALTELIGGVAILLGLFTRFWSLGVAAVVAMALWMTAIGPVVMLGAPGWPSFMPFLPSLNGYRIDAWQTWLWQFMLLAGALSLVCLGPGALSLDRLFFGASGKNHADSDDEHDNG